MILLIFFFFYENTVFGKNEAKSVQLLDQSPKNILCVI